MESLDSLLRAAIADRRLISFTLHGLPRVGEPHDYGVIKGVATLFFYQTGGQSNSGKPLGWRRAVVAEIARLHLLNERFAGARPTSSGRHIEWDELFATVHPRE
jgi:hypothetical protein